MGKKAVFSLQVLIEVVLAILGAMLLAYIGVEVYDFFFGMSIDKVTEESVKEVVYYAELWADSKIVQQSVIPFMVGGDEVVVMFGKHDQTATFRGYPEVKRPRDLNCKQKSCICVMAGSDKEKINVRKKCWELKGVDEVKRGKFTSLIDLYPDAPLELLAKESILLPALPAVPEQGSPLFKAEDPPILPQSSPFGRALKIARYPQKGRGFVLALFQEIASSIPSK